MTKTVLIVEDNELNMKLFNDLLEAQAIGRSRRRMVSRRCNWRARTSPI